MRDQVIETTPRTKYGDAKKAYAARVLMRRSLLDGFLVLLGVLSAGFGLKGFLLPNGFVDGGATGISLLLSRVTGMPLALLLILVNSPFILMGFSQIGRNFGIKTAVAIVALAITVAVVPYPVITADKLLVPASV